MKINPKHNSIDKNINYNPKTDSSISHPHNGWTKKNQNCFQSISINEKLGIN